jgi:GH18 family chitinase
MTYDFHGSWDQNRAHHSSLNSKDNEKDDNMYIVCTNNILFVSINEF